MEKRGNEYLNFINIALGSSGELNSGMQAFLKLVFCLRKNGKNLTACTIKWKMVF
jgi:hypothetical protein